LRDLVPVADVEAAHADEIVGEFGGQLVAGHILDLQSLQIKNAGHRQAGQTVQFSGVLDQVFSQPEFVVAFDPGDARVGQRAPKTTENASPDFDLAVELFAAAGYEVVARNLPEVLEVPVQDQPVGSLAAQKHFEKQKRL